jgi:hypothetical protein
MSSPENKLPLMDMQISTSKNRMRAFRARRALAETTEQKETRLAIDRQYRKQRVDDFRLKKQTKTSTRILYLVVNTK